MLWGSRYRGGCRMNNLRVWSGILLLIFINFFILTTRHIWVLVLLFTSVYLFGFVTQSKRRVLQRLTTFMYIGISLLFFQMLINQSVSVIDRVSNALRVTLQIASISQIVFLMVQYISPSAFVSALRFLPRTWQLLLTMTFAYIPILVDEQSSIQTAQVSRGLGVTWRSRLIAPVAFFIPLMHRILQRSETLGHTIVARGFVEE